MNRNMNIHIYQTIITNKIDITVVISRSLDNTNTPIRCAAVRTKLSHVGARNVRLDVIHDFLSVQ